VESEVSQVSAGAYNPKGCHIAIADRDARATIPSGDGALYWGDGHSPGAILKNIDAKGNPAWKSDSGYDRCSFAENMMCWLKQLGDCLLSRTSERQITESRVRATIIDIVTYMGMPQSVGLGKFHLQHEGERG